LRERGKRTGRRWRRSEKNTPGRDPRSCSGGEARASVDANRTVASDDERQHWTAVLLLDECECGAEQNRVLADARSSSWLLQKAPASPLDPF
jgi:hypothetical protein